MIDTIFGSAAITVLKRRGFFQCVWSLVGYFKITNQHLEIRENLNAEPIPPPSIQANLENAHESVKWVI